MGGKICGRGRYRCITPQGNSQQSSYWMKSIDERSERTYRSVRADKDGEAGEMTDVTWRMCAVRWRHFTVLWRPLATWHVPQSHAVYVQYSATKLLVILTSLRKLSAAADGPPRRVASRLMCYTQRWTLSVMNWRRSSVELSCQHLHWLMCCGEIFLKSRVPNKVPEGSTVIFWRYPNCLTTQSRITLTPNTELDPFIHFDFRHNAGLWQTDRRTQGHR